MQVTRKRARMKRMHELEQEAPVCEEVRDEHLTEAVQETVVQETEVQEEGLVIVTEAVQETEVQQIVPEGLVEGLLDDDLLIKSLQ